MKGISAVIATILLLLITVAIVGLSFGFFSGITSTSGQAAQNATTEQVNKIAKQVGIDATSTTTVSVKSTGTVAIAQSEITVYVNGPPVTCTWSGTFPLVPGSVATCTFAPACSAGQAIRVTGPVNSAGTNC